MGRVMRHGSGFSLVELLVSMVLLSTIVMLASYSYSQFAKYWDGRLGKFDSVFLELRDEWLLSDILSSIHPYVVKNNQNIPRFYFEGNVNGFVAVSNKSISQVSIGAVIRISLVLNDDLTYDMLYEEAPMAYSALTRLTESPQFSAPKLLFAGLVDPKFTYFGPQVRREEEILRPDTWSSSYNSASTLFHPKKIRFSWIKDGRVESWSVDLIQPRGGELDALKPEGFDV